MEINDRPKRYFVFYFVMLRILGLGWWHHPEEDNMNNFPTMYLPYCLITQMVWVVGFVGLETLDPFIGVPEDVSRLMFSISFVITHDLTLFKLLIFFTKNKSIQEVTRTLEIEMYDYYQNHDMNRSTKRFTKILTTIYWFFGFVAVVNSIVSGAVQDHRHRRKVSSVTLNDSMMGPTRKLALPMYVPWDYQEDNRYILTYFLETCGLLWTGHIILIIDTFIASLIIHMSAQFKILQEAFATVYERSIMELGYGIKEVTRGDVLDEVIDDVNTYSEQEIEQVLEKNLKSCIRQHQTLISCVQKFSDAYSTGFLIQLMSSTGAICVIMVQISMDASSLKSISFATSLAFFMAMIIQLALQCITGSELTWQAGKVTDAAGQCKWEKMSPRLRKYLILVIARAQRPIRFSACGFANIDNECFLSIVKGAYSYYAVLSQKQE